MCLQKQASARRAPLFFPILCCPVCPCSMEYGMSRKGSCKSRAVPCCMTAVFFLFHRPFSVRTPVKFGLRLALMQLDPRIGHAISNSGHGLQRQHEGAPKRELLQLTASRVLAPLTSSCKLACDTNQATWATCIFLGPRLEFYTCLGRCSAKRASTEYSKSPSKLVL